MERFWKWLMKADARGVFVLSVVLFLVASAWSAFTVARSCAPSSCPPPSRGPVPPAAGVAPYRPVGVLGFVSNQLSPGAIVLPVNPFHPSFEAMVRSFVAKGGAGGLVVRGRHGQVVAPPEMKRENGRAAPAAGKTDDDADGEAGAGDAGGDDGAAEARPRPTIVFLGMMQRPDGKFAAYVGDSERGASFVVVGDEVRGAKVVASGEDGVELEFPGGRRVSLGPGDPPCAVGGGEDGE